MFLERTVTCKLRESEYQQIEEILNKKAELKKYECISHFVRCAVIKLIREETKK